MAFALWKGNVGARLAAVCVILLNLGVDLIRLSFAQATFETIELSMDLACAIALLFLAVRFANLWIGAAMIFQAAQFTLHSYYIVMDLPHDLIHAWIYNLDEVGLALSIVIGAILAMRHRVTVEREAAELEALRLQRASARA